MNYLYSLEYLNKNEKQLKLLVLIYSIIISLFAIGIVTVIVIYANEPFGTTLRTPLIWILITLTAVATIFSFFYFSLILNPVKNYVKFLKYTVFGTRYKVDLTVLDVFYQPQNYRGLDFYRLLTLEWSDAKNDYVEHTVLVDANVVLEGVNKGDILTCELASSCLVGYSKGNYEKK